MDLLSLELLAVGEETIGRGELLVDQVDSLDHLNVIKAAGFTGALKLLQNTVLNIWMRDELGWLTKNAFAACKLLELLFVKRDDGSQELRLGVDVDVNLINKLAVLVNCLKLLRNNILSVLELIDLRNSINNFNGAIWLDLNDISNFEPAIFIKNFLGQLWVLKVTLHHRLSFDVELTNLAVIIDTQTKLWNISDVHSVARVNASLVTTFSFPVT